VRVHRQVAQALEEIHGDTSGPHLAELALHAIAGNDLPNGIRYAQRAGDRALELLAYEEAARQYSSALKALDSLPAPDGELRCELLVGIGDAMVRGGDTAAAKEAFLEAAELARRLGLSHLFAYAAAGYAREDMYLRKGGDVRLVALIEEALGVVGEEDVELRARLLGRLAGALRDELSRSRRDDVSHTAVELARRSGNSAALAYALDGRVAAIVGPDTIEECLALATELRDLAESIGDVPRIIHATLHRLIALLTLGEVSELETGIERIDELAGQLREPSQLWDAVAARAAFALAQGRLNEGAELSRRAFELGEGAKPEAAVPVYRLQRYTLHDLRGELAEVEQELRELVESTPARVAFRCALAHLDARQGRTSEAQQSLAELGRNRFAAVPFDQEWLFGLSFLAETSALVGDVESARVLYDLLLPYEKLVAADWPEGIRGAVARYLGLLATTTKQQDEAERHFEYALELNAKMGFRPWLAHAQADYARPLGERGGPDDAARAADLLTEAVSTYRALGMDAYANATSGVALAH
jgi:tetratricopeptide (TPR) repeat protein